MTYRIYQIDIDRDRDRVAFLGLAEIEKYQASPEVNRNIYEMTCEGQCPEEGKTIPEILEELFIRFNRAYLLPTDEYPDNPYFRRMSVSDVVEVIGEDGAESSFWYCDNIGFKKIPFRSSGIRENAEHCICCDEIIPEGRQVCPACERGAGYA